jgi:2-desacetyl-2-hydroxyethyl bacteriochlorophyllide A dehydrogenase
MLTARAFWTIGKGIGEIREEPIAPPGPGEVLVETLYSGISRGTESLVFHGHVPASEYERMRAPHQAGAFPFPVKYGYLNVGRVARGPAALEGRSVFCLFPHQSRYVVAAGDVALLPPGVDPARAVLAGNLETAINAVWDADVRVGDRVSVVGAGVLGSLVAYVAGRIVGCRVELVDVVPERAAVAAALGVSFASPETAQREADVVLHASGTAAGLATAISLAAYESTVVEMSWYGDRPVDVPLGGAFHARRLTLRSSQVGGIPRAQRARWTYRRRLELALSLLTDPALDVLVDRESPFDDIGAVLAAPGTGLCHRLRYSPRPCSPSESETTS